MMLSVPDLSKLSLWLDQLNIKSYQCGYCNALHLSHLKNMPNVFDAKVELSDDIIDFSIITEIKSSAITALLAELSQINASSRFVKAFFEITDDTHPKIIFKHVFDCVEGITKNQFATFITNVEEEALQIISELSSYDMLSYQDKLADDFEESISSANTYH